MCSGVVSSANFLPGNGRLSIFFMNAEVSRLSEICTAFLSAKRLGGTGDAQRLEDKGFVQRSESPRGYLYTPSVSDTVAKKSALSDIVRVFFNGSPASAASALLGMSGQAPTPVSWTKSRR